MTLLAALLSDYRADIGVSILFYIMIGVGLNLLIGYAGEVSMATAAFFGIGAYTAGRLALAPGVGGNSSRGVNSGLGWNIYAAGGVAILVTFLSAFAISLPAVRVRGEYLILLTLSFTLVVNDLMNSLFTVTGGPYGLTPIGPLTLPWGKQLLFPHQVFWPLLLLTLIVVAIAWRIGESPFGRVLKGMREHDTAVRSVGKNTFTARTLVFAIAAAFAGLAGALNGFYISTVSPSAYTLDFSIFMVAVVVLGGPGNLTGTIIGATLLGILPAVLQSTLTASNAIVWQAIIYGAALVLLVRFRPAGLLPERVGVFPLAHWVARQWHHAAVAPEAHPAGWGNPAVAYKPAETPPRISREGDEGSVVLRLEEISKRFGGLQAADDVSFEVREGQITALIGPNGAGKTTVFNLVTGALKPDSGRVFLRGEDVTGLPLQTMAKKGLARSFQDVRIFRRLSALENVAVAVPNQPGENPLLLANVPLIRSSEARTRAKARETLAFVGIVNRDSEIVGNMSFGDQKLIAIARLLATDCSVLLLDEPTTGVDPDAVENVIEVIRGIRTLNRTVLLVEHSVHFVERLADHVVFMDQGKVISQGALATLLSDPHLAEIYFGT